MIYDNIIVLLRCRWRQILWKVPQIVLDLNRRIKWGGGGKSPITPLFQILYPPLVSKRRRSFRIIDSKYLFTSNYLKRWPCSSRSGPTKCVQTIVTNHLLTNLLETSSPPSFSKMQTFQGISRFIWFKFVIVEMFWSHDMLAIKSQLTNFSCTRQVSTFEHWTAMP